MMNFTEQELHEMYDEMLNECEEIVKCCGMEFEPADVLKTMDPVAYRGGFNDWLDASIQDECIFEHSDGNYYSEPEEEDEDEEL